MRKQDVFGRKINQSKPLYLLVIVFALLVLTYIIILNLKNFSLNRLSAEEAQIQTEIDDLLDSSQTVTYHEIAEIIPYLPITYNQASVVNELNLVKNLSGLSLAEDYRLTFTEAANSPFSETLPTTIKFIHISISMTIADPTLVMDYIDALLEQDRLFYINTVNVSYTTDGGAYVSMSVYTFYNDIDLD